MKYALPIIILLGIAFPVQNANAQDWFLSPQVSASLPFGDFAETYKFGLGGDVTVSYRVLDQLFLTGAAGYHIFSRELKGNIVDGKFTTIPIVIGARYEFEPATLTPYLLGEVGLHFISSSYDRDDITRVNTITKSETDTGFGIGGGILYDLAGLRIDANLKYILVSSSPMDFSYVQISAGLNFPI